MIKHPQDAALIAQKIIYALQVEFFIDGKEIFIGASVGISIFPKDGSDVDSLIKAADIAMYQVKNRGKNNHCFYSEDLSKNAVEPVSYTHLDVYKRQAAFASPIPNSFSPASLINENNPICSSP